MLSELFAPKKLGPSYPEKPIVDEFFESNVKGIYIIGDISGTALIKLALNQGHQIASQIDEKLKKKSTVAKNVYDVVVVGAGCAGLGATREFHKRGLNYICLDAGRFAQTIRNFTKGKPLFLEPLETPFHTEWGINEGTRESVLSEIEEVVSNDGLKINEFEKIINVEKKDDLFKVTSDKAEYVTRTVILAIGKSGNPRKAGVKGEIENAEKIFHRLIDPDEHKEQEITIYGGGDVALEAAQALAITNNVNLVTIDKEFTFPKKRNIDGVLKLEKEGKLNIFMETTLKEVSQKEITIQKNNENGITFKNDILFEMIGSELPMNFLKKMGIRLESDWPISRKLKMVFSLLFVYCIYAWKKSYFPFNNFNFIGNLPGIFSKTSFWYSLVYSLLMLFFGIKAMKRWNKKGKDTYQTYRFISLISFQIIGFLIIEIILSITLPNYWWRFYGINNPFPLLFDAFFNWSGMDDKFWKYTLIGLCFFSTFIAIPVFVRKHGKRFCTWICGCGGLAETFGDKWRHLSHKGVRAEKWEIVGTIFMFWAFLSALVILFYYNGNTGASGLWHKSYAILIDFWLIAVIPVGLYPFFGGKVWCRFWCPLAKFMQVLSKAYSTLQISSNEKCINCTKCSYYCQVGVDVMSFAKNSEPFHNGNSSCIHCGICITVCPMDVLTFDNDRFKVNKKYQMDELSKLL